MVTLLLELSRNPDGSLGKPWEHARRQVRYTSPMHALEHLTSKRNGIEGLCRKYAVKRLRLFGSALRNIIIHGYDAIDPKVIWAIIEDRLPERRALLSRLLEEAHRQGL